MRATGALSHRLCMATKFAATGIGLWFVFLLFVVPSLARVDNTAIGLSRLVDGVWWSERLENLVPRGFGEDSDRHWREICRNRTIVALVTDETCGYNKKVTFMNRLSRMNACCRQRNNVDQIQGDIFSFYLARQLGIGHLPPACLLLPRTGDSQWSSVRSQLALTQWRNDRPLVVTHFVQELGPAEIPMQLRENGRRLHPVWRDLSNQSDSELVNLVQWSDLILFDYLTANLDRVVNNLYNKQWNEDMMNAPAHNLGKVRNSGLLMFLDNESGLVHGYRLLHKYEPYHRAFLNSLCVFRKRTVDTIRRLHRHGNAGSLIQSAFDEMEGELAASLPPFPNQSRKILQKRIARIHEHVKWCEEQYPVA